MPAWGDQMASLAPGPLDADQRRLLSAAFKNVMGRCRASWRALTTYASLSEVQSDLELMEMCVVGVPVVRVDTPMTWSGESAGSYSTVVFTWKPSFAP